MSATHVVYECTDGDQYCDILISLGCDLGPYYEFLIIDGYDKQLAAVSLSTGLLYPLSNRDVCDKDIPYHDEDTELMEEAEERQYEGFYRFMQIKKPLIIMNPGERGNC